MSEATLTKIQTDCAKMEAELAVYRNSQPVSTSCEAIIGYISDKSDPFAPKPGESNPWHSSGGDGGCSIS